MSAVLPPCGECRTRACLAEARRDIPEGAQMPGPHSLLGDRLREQAAADPAAWWAVQARERLHWDTPFSSVLDDSNPPFYTWFADGTINVSYNRLDRHVLAGRGDRVAFHWRGEEGEERDLTYAELLRDVQRLSNALQEHGIRKGDVIGIYLPMIPEVIVAMLACARIGAPHAVVFGGLAPTAVREQLEISGARALIIADGARRKGRLVPVKRRVDRVISDLPGGADGGRAPAIPALLVRLRGQAQGNPAHHGRVPHRGHHHHRDGLRPGYRPRHLLVHGRCRLHHRSLIHRVRPAGQRLHLGD